MPAQVRVDGGESTHSLGSQSEGSMSSLQRLPYQPGELGFLYKAFIYEGFGVGKRVGFKALCFMGGNNLCRVGGERQYGKPLFPPFFSFHTSRERVHTYLPSAVALPLLSNY